MSATTTKTDRIASPAITFGDRGRRRAPDLWTAGSCPGSARGGTSLSGGLATVIASCRLPCPWVDQHVDHVREEVGGQHHQGDDHEDALHQGVVELAQGVVEVVAD